MHHPLFGEIGWDNLPKAEMPFIPNPDDETDTGYFEGTNNLMLDRFVDYTSELVPDWLISQVLHIGAVKLKQDIDLHFCRF